MEYQKAVDVLQNLAKKPEVTAEEKEALSTAIGMLTIGVSVMSKARDKKAKRDKSIEW